MGVVCCYAKLFTQNKGITVHHLRLRVMTSALGSIVFAGSYLSPVLFSFALACVLIFILVYEWPRLMKGHAFVYTSLSSILYPILPFVSLIALTLLFHTQNKLIPLYPFLVAWIGDTCAYFAGKNFGKNKICPNISPGKTWEGLLGAFFGVFIFHIYTVPYLAPFFGTSKDHIIFYSIVGTLLGFFGDIFVSYLKRKAAVKDTGTLLPGHGGFLDRFDSVMFLGVITLLYVLASAL